MLSNQNIHSYVPFYSINFRAYRIFNTLYLHTTPCSGLAVHDHKCSPSLQPAHSYYLSSAGGAGGEGKVNCIHSTWGRAVKFYVETKYDLDPHRAASNPAQVSSAPAGHQALAGR